MSIFKGFESWVGPEGQSSCTTCRGETAPGNKLRRPWSPTNLLSLTFSSSAFPAVVAPAPATLLCSQWPAGQGPSHLLAKLVLLKHTAEQVSFPEQRRPDPPMPLGLRAPPVHNGDRQPRQRQKGAQPTPWRTVAQTAQRTGLRGLTSSLMHQALC